MKAVMAPVPPEILALRKRTGADRYDEMWEGVLHMVAAPNREHQDLKGALETYLRLHWARPCGCKVYSEINLAKPGEWPGNYRIPDLVLLTPERFAIDRNEWFEGPPEVVVEIRSPDDESYEKLEFYAALGVPEVWIIERDSKIPEIYRLTTQPAYQQMQADADGWLQSASVPVELRPHQGKLSIRLTADHDSQEELPN
ncbi:MAG: Uma2 family endonuclease [Candidatus Eremiobacteraeota bacterium]|nr:Uma2 family endonuclease [Candidatus Eremiobacteraeota bacterium]